MKKLMLVKDVNIKTLVSGDKNCQIKLESLNPKDITDLAKLADMVEVEVEFKIDKEK